MNKITLIGNVVHTPQLSVQAGMQGRLTVRFVGKGYWRLFDAVSLITAAALVCLSLPRKKKRNA